MKYLFFILFAFSVMEVDADIFSVDFRTPGITFSDEGFQNTEFESGTANYCPRCGAWTLVHPGAWLKISFDLDSNEDIPTVLAISYRGNSYVDDDRAYPVTVALNGEVLGTIRPQDGYGTPDHTYPDFGGKYRDEFDISDLIDGEQNQLFLSIIPGTWDGWAVCNVHIDTIELIQ